MLERITISSLNEYLGIISEFRKKIKSDEGTGEQRLFFRGQENETWPIMPSVFRNDYLSIEGKIIRVALSKCPGEFRDQTTPFEQLTKLQHYGLSTRLLDVTLNPLVAMYFACLPCYNYDPIDTDNSDCEEKFQRTSQNGAIYYKREYEMYPDSLEVKILSIIAGMELAKDSKIEDVLKVLKMYGIILKSPEELEKVFNILQSNYFVICNQTNDRLIRQSGAFLIPGAININKDDNIFNSTVSKATCNLQNEFSEEVFIINHENKDEILEELDFYNINKATLFPELEHQMKYIKESNGRYVTSVAPFSKLEEELRKIELENLPNIQNDIDDAFKENLKNIISKALNNKNPKLIDNLFNLFIENAGLDWYRKEQIQANIRNEMFRTMKSDKQFRQDGKKIAEMILSQAIEAFLKVAAVSE